MNIIQCSHLNKAILQQENVMNTNVKYRNGKTGVKWFADYAAAKTFWRLNKATVALVTDRMGNIV